MGKPTTATSDRSHRRRNTFLLVGALVLAGAAAGGFGFWYALIAPASPGPAAPEIPAGASVAAPPAIDGNWQINDSIGAFSDFSSSWLGYRVQEQFVGVGGHTAIGRTPKVTGSLTITGSTVSAGSITADLSALVSDAPQRDGELGGAGI